ncbi:MAG: ABC transporter substrate-binding protein [Spirochaetales bacterium]|nr:ABC transporter substrate-binding protein [Spirochaetales bacterium]
MKKILSCILIGILALASVFAQGESEASSSKKAEVYFLNFKPEIASVYEEKVAPAFEAETGIKLKVVTAASGTYASTLKSEMAKSNPPAIFQTNGPVGLADSKADVADLSNTNFYKLLADKSMALSVDGKISAIPYAVEGYGIIYNQAIMEKYFALEGAKAKSMDEISNFATLKAVAEDMQAKKEQLGIKGVFASTSFGPGQDWRWHTHLMNVALYGEYSDPQAALVAKDFAFKYGENYKALFDLYIDNSTTAKGLLGSKSVDDSMAEFALGQCAMVQNGNWGAGQILGVTGNKVASEDIKFIPLYMGLEGEDKLGLCVGTENYLCINTNISQDAQANADKFLTWLFSSTTGKKIVKEDLGFITPFNSFEDSELPTDPLAKDVTKWMNKAGVASIPWVFAGIPSEQWKNDFGGQLLQYVQGNSDWASVVKIVQDSWTKEAEIAGR